MQADLDLNDIELLRQAFQEETEELLAEVEEALLALENQTEDEELVDDIFRGLHTIKGNARVVGFEKVAVLAHAAEDLLDGIRAGKLGVTSNLVSLLLRTVDALKRAADSAAAGNDELDSDQLELKRELARTVSSISVDSAPDHRKSGLDCDEKDLPADASSISGRRRKSLRVGVDKLDKIMDLVGEISIARGRVTEMLGNGNGHSKQEILETRQEADLLYMELQELVMQMRMVPIGPLFREYKRTVRDLALESGKAARLIIEGDDVEVDTTVIEHLRDPLTHLIRNAVNHGIETSKERSGLNKPPVGKVTLRAFHEAGWIVVQIQDDGAGIDLEKVLRKAKESGFVKEEENPEKADSYGLVFEPGFSTADEITDISGRGVGMDVVKKNVELLRGAIKIESQQGKGTTITMRLPLTLAIIEGFKVGVSDQTYVVPLDNVVECVELSGEASETGKGTGLIKLRGKSVPFLDMKKFFGLNGGSAARQNVIVVRHESREAGLVADALLGEGQTVIKPLNKLFKDIPGLAGTAIMGNGRVAFVLDVPGLLRAALSGRDKPVSSATVNG